MQTFIKNNHQRLAFSLVEVVIAVGIFAISIVAVIGLLGPTNKSVADVRDTDDANRIVGAIQSQLQNIAEMPRYPTPTSTTGGFDFIGANILQPPDSGAITGGGDTDHSYTIYASRDGSKIGLYGDANTWNPPGSNLAQQDQDKGKYFEVVLIRNTDLSPNAGDNTDLKAGFLAFTIRLRWPAYTPDGVAFTDSTQKSVLLVPAAIHR